MLKRLAPLVLLSLGLGLVLAGCSDDDSPAPTTDNYDATIQEFNLAPLPTTVPYPPNNQYSAERIGLGWLLFFDPILGGESAPWVKKAAGRDPYLDRANDMACATCHHPNWGFADGRRLSAGVSGGQFNGEDLGTNRVVPGHSIVTGNEIGIVPRNAPSIFNTGANGLDSIEPAALSVQFLDGRVTKGLDEQAKLPITSRDEMAGDAYGDMSVLTAEDVQDSVVNRIRNIPEYVDRFKQAFGTEITQASDIELDHIARAIGAFEREIMTPGSRYDEFLLGNRNAFNDQEKQGFELFFGKGLCGDCHSGPMLSDFSFRVQGAAEDYDKVHPGFEGKNGEGGDWGRFQADPEKFADKKFFFRTLTVRNVEITGPYFHSGSAGTLREVVEFYNRGGRGDQDIPTEELEAAGVERDESIKLLELTSDEMDAIVAFMRTTTGLVQPGPSGSDLTAVPTRVPSGLLPPGIPTPPGKAGPFYPEPGDADLK